MVLIVGFLFGALQISAVAVQITGVPSQIATMIQGSIMLFVIAGEFFKRYKITRQNSQPSLPEKSTEDPKKEIPVQEGGAE